MGIALKRHFCYTFKRNLLLGEKNELHNRSMYITGLKPSGASKLIKRLLACGIIEPIAGYGKGKYRFV